MIHLHVHSDYSLLDGLCKIDSLFEKAKEAEHEAIAITDHGNLDCYVKALKASQKYGVKYIPAVEMYLANNVHKVEPKEKYRHLCLYALNMDGLSELFRILGYANQKFVRKPIVDIDTLTKDFDLTNIAVSTACLYGILSYNNCEEQIEKLIDATDNLFIEIMPHNIDEQVQMNERAVFVAEDYNLPLIATNDVHYIEAEHVNSHDVLLAINTNRKVNDKDRFRFKIRSLYYCTEDEMLKMFRKQKSVRIATAVKAIDNTNRLCELVDFKSFGGYGVELNVSGYKRKNFMRLIEMRFRNILKKIPAHKKEIYRERLKKELDLIVRKKFDTYFYVVYDIIKYARNNGIYVGCGRGSVGGSLLAYVLGITTVDPIKFGLSFERFIAEDRIDLPDIDMDFEDRKRDIVIQYISEKYGRDGTCNISTFGQLKPKGVIRDVARIHDVSRKDIDMVSKNLIKVSDDDNVEKLAEENEVVADFFMKYPELLEHSKNLENVIRNSGVHAAGIVVCEQDINETGRGYLVKRNNKYVLNWDKDDAEYMGFIKYDILGLNTLTVISECIRLIEERHGEFVDVYSLPLNDRKTLSLFEKGDTTGVFQFSSGGMKQLLKNFGIDKFHDLCVINALYRPGTLGGGIHEKYISVKRGEDEPNFYGSEAYRRVTKNTYGFIIYQEQLLKVFTEFGFTYSEADKIRKICSKKKGKSEIVKYKKRFVEYAVKNAGMKKSDASDLFDTLENFAEYAFNLAHATEYAMIGYWTAYLKCHYYDEYMQSLLTYGSEHNRQEYIDELMSRGYKFRNVNINRSSAIDWVVLDGEVYLPFISILGIGEKAARVLEQARNLHGEISTPEQLFQVVPDRKAVNKRIVNLLIDAGAFDDNSKIKKEMLKVKITFAEEVLDLYRRWLSSNNAGLVKVQKKLKDGKKVIVNFVEDDLNENVFVNVKHDTYASIAEGDLYYAGFSGKNMLGIATTEQMRKLELDSTGANIQVISGIEDASVVRRKIKKCSRCQLRSECREPVAGEYNSNILLVGEAPGRDEDRYGKPFVGKAGQLLFKVLGKYGVERSDVSIINTVKCWPSKTKTPDSEHVKACKSHFVREIKHIEPVIILSLGSIASKVLSDNDSFKITENAGTCEYNDKIGAWVMYCLHPSHVLRGYEKDRVKLFTETIRSFVEKIIFLNGGE